MKKFAVAFISFFENELEIQFIETADVLAAGQTVLIRHGYDLDGEKFTSLKDMKKFCFDGDCMIDVKELP